MSPPLPILVRDKREQTPFIFSDEVQVYAGTLASGDYAVLAPDVQPYLTRRRTPRKRDAPPPAFPALYAPEVGAEEHVAVFERADGTTARMLCLPLRVERKSLPDLVACVTRERDRFEAELRRLAGMSRAVVVVEASASTARAGAYRSQVIPPAVINSTISWHLRYGVPTVWLDDAREAARWTERWLTMALEQHIEAERARAVEAGHAAMIAAADRRA